jgi:hypothetical protein
VCRAVDVIEDRPHQFLHVIALVAAGKPGKIAVGRSRYPLPEGLSRLIQRLAQDQEKSSKEFALERTCLIVVCLCLPNQALRAVFLLLFSQSRYDKRNAV